MFQLNFKKLRFLLLSFTLVGLVFFIANRLAGVSEPVQVTTLFKFVVIISITTILSSSFVQYLSGGGKKITTIFYVGFSPVLVILGCFLLFLYYPNLSIFLKLISGLFYTIVLYTMLLLNNVLLVVESREVSIPVYRVALSWVQIVLLSSVLAIFTGLLRLPVHSIVQAGLIIVVSFFCYSYLFWVYSNEKEVRSVKVYEGLVLCSAFGLLTGWSSFITLFFPAESFLRGIFISSVFLLGLGYIQSYLKNSLSRRNIREYLLICLMFFTILMLFKP